MEEVQKNVLRHFLEISNGSINELKIQLEISERPGFTSEKELEPSIELCTEVQKMTITLIKKYTNSN